MIKKMFINLIRFYQKYISKVLGSNCRHIPTCSNYAIEAYEKHNVFYATLLTIYRILRCNPLGKGGFDPVPEPKKRKIK